MNTQHNTQPAQAGDGTERIALGTAAYRRMALALLMAGFSTFALLYSAQPLLPIFSAQFNIGAAQSSLAVSFATGAMALCFIPAGILSDRIGRRPLMIASLFAAALLTAVSAIVPEWHVFLLMRALTGIALAGIPSVAMAYIAEEMDGASMGAAMGVYIGGSAIGGMVGRIGVTLLTEHFGWRPALGATAAAGLVAAALFWKAAPRSQAFVSRRHDLKSVVRATGRLLQDAALPWLFAAGFVLMGAFVSIYNYVGFRLLAPPYSLSQSMVGAIFLLYIIGSISSAWVGGLAGRIGRAKIFWIPIVAMLVGVAFTAAHSLILMVLGIAVITGAFFGAHSVASGWVGLRAGQDRAQAGSLYLLFYYLGSSILGSAGGIAWNLDRWNGVALFAMVLVFIAFCIAGRLTTVTPLASTRSQLTKTT
ncbi:MFS transporter [Undibacterium terreum]|uniref:MFS transporter n=1 Tax=Undibacterium terreum TaxID=1224302 RepID=A0A916ULF7_9BURK|nr:MFS transporter [Undibacterium terreum]GGC77533.1 MFS transporter [Undibacterium terreum]